MAAGCTEPNVTIMHATCAPARESGKSDSVEFVSDIETRNLDQQQLILRVNLEDSRRHPIVSSDGRFQDSAGHVAATRAFMVLQSPWTIEHAVVAIPLDQLELKPEDMPAIAVFSACLPDGTVLASSRVRLPVGTASAAFPERIEPQTAPDQGPPPAARTQLSNEAERPRTAESAQRQGARRASPTRRRSTDGVIPPTHPSTDVPAQHYDVVPRHPDESAGDRQGSTDGPRPDGRGDASRAPETAAARKKQESVPRPDSRVDTQPAPRPLNTPQPNRRPANAAPPTPAAGEASPARTYTVKKGDTLSSVARRVLGDSYRWTEIYILNRDRLESPDTLPEGTQLVLPAVANP